MGVHGRGRRWVVEEGVDGAGLVGGRRGACVVAEKRGDVHSTGGHGCEWKKHQRLYSFDYTANVQRDLATRPRGDYEESSARCARPRRTQVPSRVPLSPTRRSQCPRSTPVLQRRRASHRRDAFTQAVAAWSVHRRRRRAQRARSPVCLRCEEKRRAVGLPFIVTTTVQVACRDPEDPSTHTNQPLAYRRHPPRRPMSVATNNPFSVLDGEFIPYLSSIPISYLPDDASSRPSTPPPAAPSAPQKSATAPPAKQNQRGKGPAARGGRYYSRGGATKGADAPTTAEEPAVGAEDTKRRCKSLPQPAPWCTFMGLPCTSRWRTQGWSRTRSSRYSRCWQRPHV